MTIEVGAFAVLHDLVEIAPKHVRDFVDLGSFFYGNGSTFKRFHQLIDQLDRERGEIVHEVERVLDFMRDAGGELAERGELLRLDQTILCGAQILQRAGELGLYAD